MLNALLWNLLLTAVLALTLAALCRAPFLARRPALRHGLWLLLMAKLVTPPLIALPLLPAVTGGDASNTMAAPSVESTRLDELSPHSPVMPGSAFEETASAPTHSVVTQLGPNDFLSRTQVPLLAVLAAISLMGTGALAVFHGYHAVKLHRWLARAGKENAALAAVCAEVASCLKVRGVVRSCVVDARITPLVLGLRRPLIVAPRRLLDDLGPQQVRGMVAHELAHLSRRDPWTNLFAFVVKSLLWWNPVAWWADRQRRAAQELCCDAIAIDRCGADRRGYAATLLKALDLIQTEPWAPRALAPGMASRGSILRRFEMIGEKRLSYQLSRWTFLMLVVLAIPLVCMPVRGQDKTPAANDPGTAADADLKKDEAAKPEQPKKDADADAPAIDPKTKALGEAVHKRITTYSDEMTLTLKDGETGRMPVKKNVTPVAEILITAHFVDKGATFDLEGVDASGKAIEGSKITSRVVHDAGTTRMGLGKSFPVDGEAIMSKIQLHPTRQGDDTVAVEVKALFTRLPSPEEIKAMLMTRGKSGQMQVHFQEMVRWIMEYQTQSGRYPKDLKELKKPLPKDVYSPNGEDYHYEAQRSRFILSSCGKDGIYGNDDDEILISHGGGQISNQRRELYPLEDEKEAKGQKEDVMGARPKGNCSISGKVVEEATGKPVPHAKVYMFYVPTYAPIFITVADDGTFVFKDVPKGPYSLRTTNTAGYQDAVYNPDGQPGLYPQFTLKDGEQRSDVVLKVKEACRISGKVMNEKGELPDNIDTLMVLAWFKKDAGEGTEGYSSQQAPVKRSDGSYLIDGLADKPCYVMAINWRAAQRGEASPPIYYPSTFSRKEAKQITFDQGKSVDNVDITMKKQGGLVLEGTVRDEAGKPVPEVFVVVHHRDMLFDFATAYTDKEGHYEIQGLGEGQFQVHLDAVHRGFVRIRMPIDFDGAAKKVHRDFALTKGVVISGKFVDEQGKDWEIGNSNGSVHVERDEKNAKENEQSSSFSLTHFWNKHRPEDAQQSAGGSFALGEGGYNDSQMLFPTRNTFIIQGMIAGKTIFGFSTQKEGQAVVQILHDGKDIRKEGITTTPGQEIKDVIVVIGPQEKKSEEKKPEEKK